MIKEPYYTIEFIAISCFFEILVNDICIFSMESEGQMSPNIPINYAIYETGIQNLEIIIKPLAGNLFLTSSSEFKYKISLYDTANENFNFVKNFEFEDIKVTKDKNIPKLVRKSVFDAKVEYKLTRWDNAIELKDIKNLEERLFNSYNELIDLIRKSAFIELSNKIENRENNMAISMYFNTEQSKARINSLIQDVKSGFEILPLSNDLLLKINGFGKIASYKKLNGEPAISFLNKETREELMLDITFYIPDGKTEFEVI